MPSKVGKLKALYKKGKKKEETRVKAAKRMKAKAKYKYEDELDALQRDMPKPRHQRLQRDIEEALKLKPMEMPKFDIRRRKKRSKKEPVPKTLEDAVK